MVAIRSTVASMHLSGDTATGVAMIRNTVGDTGKDVAVIRKTVSSYTGLVIL